VDTSGLLEVMVRSSTAPGEGAEGQVEGIPKGNPIGAQRRRVSARETLTGRVADRVIGVTAFRSGIDDEWQLGRYAALKGSMT
jgi:hypothetical protein